MHATVAMPSWLAEYSPQVPLPELVEQVNQIFHEYEARYYDRRHPEVRREWAELWQEMIAAAHGESPDRHWRILDFGCGTGFASTQLLRCLPENSIASLTCYDLSPLMIQCCRDKLAPRFARANFCCQLEELRQFAPFNLLATNALLHHLPDPVQKIKQQLLPLLSDDAVWLSGFEPSCRYYKNPECTRYWNEFHQARQRGRKMWWRYLSPKVWWQKLDKLANRTPSPKRLAARTSVERGLFKHRPPPHVIDRLVDFHVPHSVGEVEQGRGLDFERLRQDFQGAWNLAWAKSTSFMGHVPERTLSTEWRNICRQLAARYPLDGSLFSVIWRRTGS